VIWGGAGCIKCRDQNISTEVMGVNIFKYKLTYWQYPFSY